MLSVVLVIILAKDQLYTKVVVFIFDIGSEACAPAGVVTPGCGLQGCLEISNVLTMEDLEYLHQVLRHPYLVQGQQMWIIMEMGLAM